MLCITLILCDTYKNSDILRDKILRDTYKILCDTYKKVPEMGN